MTQLSAAIEAHPVVDISTHGRKSGATRRIEIRLWHADGPIFLSVARAALLVRESARQHSADPAREERRRGRPRDDGAADHRHGRATRDSVSHRVAERARRVDRGRSPLVELTEV
jgi:hypothetical protein